VVARIVAQKLGAEVRTDMAMLGITALEQLSRDQLASARTHI